MGVNYRDSIVSSLACLMISSALLYFNGAHY